MTHPIAAFYFFPSFSNHTLSIVVGEGIHGSLKFTMKKYLRQTDGVLQNALRDEWERTATKHMFCHNNHAERPFAVARAFNRLYPALTLW
jgi:hypothetical protein